MDSIPQNTPRRAVVYARVSTSAQETNTSLESQTSACRLYCDQHGMEIVTVATEVWSAFTRERPELARLRAMIRAKAIDALVIYATDRLSRSQTDFAILFDEMQTAGVALHCVSEPFEDTAMGRFLISVRAFAGELEREKIRERTMRGNRTRLSNGSLRPGNRALFGYEWDNPEWKAKNRYVIHMEHAAVVRRIFDMAVRGLSLRSIARTLNDEGIPTANGAANWQSEVIRGMLRHEGYAGVAVGNRYADTKVDDKRKRVERPAAEHIHLPAGTIPPIISAETFAAVQERLTRNKAESTRNNRDPETFLLRAGFIFCGYCGKRIHTAYHKNRSGALRPSYGVLQSANDHYDCPAFSMSAKDLDVVVWAKVSSVMREGGLERELARHASATRYHGGRGTRRSERDCGSGAQTEQS